MKKIQTISVIIATKNRPKDIQKCVRSLLRSSVLPHEIIIMDQSKNKKTYDFVDNFNDDRIKYYHLKYSSKSKALNYAIKQALGEILAFTDDDCIISKDWIANITSRFSSSDSIQVCFGKTLPYAKSLKCNKTCPSVFKRYPDIFSITKKICKHWEQVGFGNNMVFRATVFEKIGPFKEWLGPGSICHAGEDAEIILRSLVNKYLIGYDPEMVVFHNKWLTTQKQVEQNTSYARGGSAAYGYYAMQGHAEAKKIVHEDLENVILEIKSITKQFIVKNRINVNYLLQQIILSKNILFGLSIAAIITILDQLFKKRY